MLRPASPPAYWLLALLLVFVIPPVLAGPFGNDQGIFAAVGQVLLNGGAPYLDAWDIKGPLVYLLYAAGLWLTPHVAFGVMLIDILLLGAALVCLCSLAQKAGQSTAFAYGACAVLLCAGSLELLFTGQPDSWAGYACIMLLALLYAPTPAKAFASGVLIGALVLLKPPYALLAVLGITLFQYPQRVRLVAAFAVGGFMVLLAGALYVYASGATAAFIEIAHFYRNVHMQGSSSSEQLFVLTSNPSYYTFWLYAGAGFAGSAGIYRHNKQLGRLLLATLALCFVIFVLQGKFYTYQRAPLLLVSSLPLAWLIAQLAAKNSTVWHKAAAYSFMLTLLVFAVAISGLSAYRAGFARWANCVGATQSQACLALYNIQGSAGRWQTAAFIKANTPQDARIFQFGYDAGLYVAGNRQPASRFIYSYPLVAPFSTWQTAYRTELLQAFEHTPPAAIVIARRDGGPGTNPKPRAAFIREGFYPSEKMLHTFPALEAYIAAHYRLAHTTPYNLVYLPR